MNFHLGFTELSCTFFSKELELLVTLPHLSAVSAASVCPGAVFREAWGWILIGRRTLGFACWRRDTQYMAAKKKIRMTTDTSIRFAPQVVFIAVMMGGHADRTCFDGGYSCVPALPLHWHGVLVKPHPIWNLDGFLPKEKSSYIEVEATWSQIRRVGLARDNERSSELA